MKFVKLDKEKRMFTSWPSILLVILPQIGTSYVGPDEPALPKVHTFACEDGWYSFDAHCYVYVASIGDRGKTFAEAQSDCWSIGAHLVSIHSTEENDFVYSLLTHKSTWIGLTHGGSSSQLTWTDNTDVTYTNYERLYSALISADLTVPSCMYITAENGHRYWNIDKCSESRDYICKKPHRLTSDCNNCPQGQEDHSFRTAPSSQRARNPRSLQEGPDLTLRPFHSRFGRPQWKRHEMAPGTKDQVIDGLLQKATMAPVVKEVSGSHVLRPSSTVESFTLSPGGAEDDAGGRGSADPPAEEEREEGEDVESSATPETVAPTDAVEATTPPADDPDGTPTPFTTTAPSTLPATTTSKEPECHSDDVPYKGSCYHFPRLEQSWEDAKSACEAAGSHLIVINDRFEGAFITSFLNKMGEKSWIGLSGVAGDSLTLRWVNGLTVAFNNWAEYQPDPEQGNCVSASGEFETLGLWELGPCSNTYQYICEYARNGYLPPTTPPSEVTSSSCASGWERYEGKCYKLFLQPVAFGVAEGTCNSYGASLTSVGSAEEQRYINSLLGMIPMRRMYHFLWVGLMNGPDGAFQWTDGSPVDHLDWALGGPDQLTSTMTCFAVDIGSAKLWEFNCDAEMPFICEATEGRMATTKAPPTETIDIPCDDDPSWLLYNDHCYKFVSVADEDPRTFWEAHTLCRQDGGELASIHTYEENYWIETKIYNKSDEMMWIGGRAQLGSGYEWLDGSVFEFVNWGKGEPNNLMDQEDCIAMYTRTAGYWNDQNCAHTEGRICKRPHQVTLPPVQTTTPPEGNCPRGWFHMGSKCFKFFNELMNFNDARNSCKALGAGVDMVSIHSADEQAYLTAVLGQLEVNTWLGMRNERGFHWVDQSSATYMNWAAGEPNGQNNEGSSEDCVEVMTHTRAGQWNDVDCTKLNGYICQQQMDPSISTPSPPPACEAPFSNYINYDGVCYRADATPMTWQDAEAACVAEGAHLASAHHLSEVALLWVLALDLGVEDIWLGLNSLENRDQFVWSDEWPAVYTNWGHKEPNTSLSERNCVTLRTKEEGHWFTELCTEEQPFVCKHIDVPVPTPDSPAAGSCPDSGWLDLGGTYCYLIVKEAAPWDGANMNCVRENAHMLSIHSQAEMDLINMATHKYIAPFWIGLVQKRDGYGWSDGTAFDYINWQVGEPNSETENCVEFYTGVGTWNDAECSNARSFICKKPKSQDIVPTNPKIGSPQESTWQSGGEDESSLTAGGIIGIVFAVLLVGAVLSFVGAQYLRRRARPMATDGAFSFDNALYSESYDGSSSVTVGGSSTTDFEAEA